MEIDFKIKNDMLVLEKQRKTLSGNVNFYKCRFEILTNKELMWICAFKKGEKVYQQVIEDGACMIPAEVLLDGGKLEIGCYASCNAEKFQRISTNWVPVEVLEGAYSEGTAPKVPEKDVWETLVLKNVPYIGENGNWYIFDTEKMEYVDSERSSVGEKGEKGDRGEMGIPGTTNAANALKGNVIGQNMLLTDVSPIEHTLDVKVKSKNLVKSAVYPINSPANDGLANVTTQTLEVGKTYTISWDTQDTGARYWVTLYSKYRETISGETSGTCDGKKHFLTFKITGKPTGNGGMAIQSSNGDPSGIQSVSNFMMEEGEVATEYTQYIDDVSSIPVEVVNSEGQIEEFVSDSKGIVGEVMSHYPEMGIATKRDGTVLDVKYNKDINKAFYELEEKVTNAIISLGGNV